MTNQQAVLVGHQIDEIREHMDEDDFQRDFFESLSDQFESRGKLSEKQMATLDRIYERVTR